jgi:hypothetical protein
MGALVFGAVVLVAGAWALDKGLTFLMDLL